MARKPLFSSFLLPFVGATVFFAEENCQPIHPAAPAVSTDMGWRRLGAGELRPTRLTQSYECRGYGLSEVASASPGTAVGVESLSVSLLEQRMHLDVFSACLAMDS